MKRWESLRTQWSREHKRKRKQKPSGSGASVDTQEFRYYGEMSFLIQYYVPRPTRGNMNKVPVGPSSSDSGSSITSVEIGCVASSSTKNCDFNYSSQLWNTNIVEDSSSTDDTLFSPQVATNSQSSSPKSLQMSSAAKATIQSGLVRSNVPSTKKFKSTKDAEIVVPASDNFNKKKKSEIDLKMDKSLEFMEKVVKKMDNVFEKKHQEQSADPEVDAAINFIKTLLKTRVKPEKQYKCT